MEADALASAGLPLSIWGRKRLFFYVVFVSPSLSLKQTKHISSLSTRLFALAFCSLCFRAQLSPGPKPCNCAMGGKSQEKAKDEAGSSE